MDDGSGNCGLFERIVDEWMTDHGLVDELRKGWIKKKADDGDVDSLLSMERKINFPTLECRNDHNTKIQITT